MGGHLTNSTSDAILCASVSTAKQLSFLLLIYLLGYLGLSLVWPCALLALLLLTDRWRAERQARLDLSRAMALGFEQDILLNRLQDIPSWLCFPDVEKVDWLNRILEQFWLTVDEYLRESVPQLVEPAVQAYFDDFKFEEVVLGHVPLRVDGVKVYDQEADSKVVMDLDVSYAGDCYVTFKTFKFTGGIKDIQLYGRLRVVMTPLLDRSPIIGGLQVYFMTEPRLDFDLIKITSFLDLPVIRKKIKNTLMKIVNGMFLFPNVYSIRLAEGVSVSKLTVFKTEGVLRVHLVEAKNLVNKDIIGKSDPYVVLTIGSTTVHSPVIQNSLNPKWDFWTEFATESNSELLVHVWDRDEGSHDESLGCAKIDISAVAEEGEDNRVVSLEEVSSGAVYLRLSWLGLSSDYSDLDAVFSESAALSPDLHCALLLVYVEAAEGLQQVDGFAPSPFVEVQVEGVTRATEVVRRSCDPMWDKGFSFMLRDLKRAVLEVQVKDTESERTIGDFAYKVSKLGDEPELEFRHHGFLLATGCVYCSMKLRIFKRDKREEESPRSPVKVLKKQESRLSQSSVSTESVASTENMFNFSTGDKKTDLGDVKVTLHYIEQRQRLVVTVHEADQLRLKNTTEWPSACVKLYLQSDHKGKGSKQKTRTVKSSMHPVYEETFEFFISSRDLATTRLLLVVTSESGLLHRRKVLGHITVDLANCDRLGDPFTDWFNLKRRRDTDVYLLTVE